MIPFDKQASIYSETPSRVDWSEVMVRSSPINTICDYWTSWNNRRRNSWEVRESKNDWYDVILPYSLVWQVKWWMIIKLYNVDNTVRWLYKIDVVEEYCLGDKNTDNILLTVSVIDG